MGYDFKMTTDKENYDCIDILKNRVLKTVPRWPWLHNKLPKVYRILPERWMFKQMPDSDYDFYFEEIVGANPQFIKDWNKTTGGEDFTIIFAVKTPQGMGEL